MKAILVVDIPKFDEDTKNGCRNCRYADCGSIGFFESYKCVLTGQCTKVYEMKCPLKPLPQKKKVKMPNYVNDYEYERGWNDCIDEILGDTE